MLKLNNIEVIYLNVILVLKGVSLEVPDGKIVALLGLIVRESQPRLRQYQVYYIQKKVKLLTAVSSSMVRE